MKKKTKMRMTMADRIFMGFTYLFLIFVFLITLYPMIFVLSASFSDPKLVAAGKLFLWPVGITLGGYEHLMQLKELWVGYANTFFYTVVGTTLNLLFTIPTAYALSRKDMKGRGFIMGIFVFTMYFSGGLIPGYLNVRSFHLLDTRTVLLILGLVSAYNLIVARTFFANTIPWELHEAAFLDGASDLGILSKVVLPLSKPILAVMMLYYGVGHWNNYFGAMIYVRDRSKFPLQLILREVLIEAQGLTAMIADGGWDPESVKVLLQQQEAANQLKYAVIVVATVPMLILYPFLEKYFAKGVMIGSVKG